MYVITWTKARFFYCFGVTNSSKVNYIVDKKIHDIKRAMGLSIVGDNVKYGCDICVVIYIWYNSVVKDLFDDPRIFD